MLGRSEGVGSRRLIRLDVEFGGGNCFPGFLTGSVEAQPRREMPRIAVETVLDRFIAEWIAPPGFEPRSQGPKPRMIGRYTTGLRG